MITFTIANNFGNVKRKFKDKGSSRDRWVLSEAEMYKPSLQSERRAHYVGEYGSLCPNIAHEFYRCIIYSGLIGALTLSIKDNLSESHQSALLNIPTDVAFVAR